MHKPWCRVQFHERPGFAALFLFIFAAAAPAAQAEDCTAGPQTGAAANAASLTTLPLNLFGRAEAGWAFYEPLITNEIGTVCEATTPGFARALAAWQSAHHLAASGAVAQAVLEPMKQLWQSRRPFVIQSKHACPAPPNETTLARATASESYGGKAILLRSEALAAYRQMVTAARAEGLLANDKQLLTIFSAYRSPAYDAARCATQHNCQGVVRASCSAHRTGYAVDLYLGAAPGFSPDSSADANRLFISRSGLYRWLVKNGARFGLMNYAFEPWHWEFVSPAALR